MDWSPVFLFFTTLHFVRAGEVRCFCNLPVCVTSGYMCKSLKGGCFSDLVDFDVYKSRHGCVELLDKERQGQCQNEPVAAARSHPRSLLLCCRSDMCNHVDSPEIKIRVNDTFLGSLLNATETRVFTSSVNYNSNEVWFKAATIAVPICGALILFILIALAVKILRKDGADDILMPKHGHLYPSHPTCVRRPHEEMYTEMSSKKVPLLLQHHNDNSSNKTAGHKNTLGHFEKNETNAKLNFASCNRQNEANLVEAGDCGVGSARENRSIGVPMHKPNNVTYRDVNIALATQSEVVADCGKYYDKQGLSFCGNVGSPSQV